MCAECAVQICRTHLKRLTAVCNLVTGRECYPCRKAVLTVIEHRVAVILLVTESSQCVLLRHLEAYELQRLLRAVCLFTATVCARVVGIGRRMYQCCTGYLHSALPITLHAKPVGDKYCIARLQRTAGVPESDLPMDKEPTERLLTPDRSPPLLMYHSACLHVVLCM